MADFKITRAHHQALRKFLKKIVTPENLDTWANLETLTEIDKFFNGLLLFYGFPCSMELRDHLAEAFEYEYDIYAWDRAHGLAK